MIRFQYSAHDAGGQLITAVIDADSLADAVAQLQTQGLAVLSIAPAEGLEQALEPGAAVDELPADAGSWHGDNRAGQDESLQRLRDLARENAAVDAGLHALVEELPRGRYRRSLSRLVELLDKGGSLQQGLRSIEIPGDLLAVLQCVPYVDKPVDMIELYVYRVRARSVLRRQLTLMLLYPGILLTAALLCAVFLLTFVVPGFSEMYGDFGIELPWVTFSLVWLSNALVFNWPTILLAISGLCGITWMVLRFSLKPETRDRWFWRIPLLGPTIRDMNYSQFAFALGTFVRNNVPLDKALEFSGEAVHDAAIRSGSRQMAEALRAGQSLQTARHPLRGFPASLIDLFQWGHQSTSFADSLQDLGELFEAQATLKTQFMNLVLRPVLVIGVGFFVFWTVIGLFMPLLRLVNALS